MLVAAPPHARTPTRNTALTRLHVNVLAQILQRVNGRRRVKDRHERTCLRPVSVDREAVDQARAAGGHQILLAAPAAGVRGVPRRVAAAGAVVVAELRRPRRAARPVAAGVVGAVGVGAAVSLRSGQDVVLVRRVAGAFDRLTLLADRGRPG